MPTDLEIRDNRPADEAAIMELYRAAFPQEDLLSLVRALLSEPDVALSLVAAEGDEIRGHVAFTACKLDAGNDGTIALLGPLAVSPGRQGSGIGTALVRDGLSRLVGRGVLEVLVLGDPAYYGRFGFRPSARIAPAFPIPDEWRTGWQSLVLNENENLPFGTLVVPAPWRRRELWAP